MLERRNAGYAACFACFLLAVLIALPTFPVSKAETGTISQNTTPTLTSTWTPPHFVPNKTVTPREIWLEGSGMTPDNATVTLTFEGNYTPYIKPPPLIDVVLGIDTSASMNETFNGKTKIEWAKDAALTFLSCFNYSINHRAAVVEFGSNATDNKSVVNLCEPFSNNSGILTNAINNLSAGGNCTPLFDGTIFAVDYANKNHSPPNQTHPHNPPPPEHHRPIVLLFTDGFDIGSNKSFQDCIDFVTNSFNIPPPSNYLGYETFVFTLGFGNATNTTELDAIAFAGGGRFYMSPDSHDLEGIYENITITLDDPDIPPPDRPEPIIEVLPPYIKYQNDWRPTVNNNASIRGFRTVNGPNDTLELIWDVPRLNYKNLFEVQYSIKSNLSGWQSVGVTKYNATNVYGSDFCCVIYENWQYYKTIDPVDIWTNETPDVSIFVKEPPVPEIANIVVFVPLSFIAIFVVIKSRRKADA